MILTGKANKDYEVWLYKNHINYWRLAWGKLPVSAQMAMMIEWLDSVGICVEIGINPSDGTDPNFTINYSYTIFGKVSTDGDLYKTRQEAAKSAIMKANELYNERR